MSDARLTTSLFFCRRTSGLDLPKLFALLILSLPLVLPPPSTLVETLIKAELSRTPTERSGVIGRYR